MISPPCSSTRSFSLGLLGLWSIVRSKDESSVTITARESPTCAVMSWFFALFTKAETTVEPSSTENGQEARIPRVAVPLYFASQS